MSEHETFSPAGYATLIAALRAQDYEPRGFADADPAARHLVLRHDVDFSLSAARAMAEQEAQLGVSATYFVLLRTEFYNPFSAESLMALQQIMACGHTVGLHFDAALYPGDDGTIEAEIARECSILETLVRRPVTVMSFHRPAPHRFGADDILAGRLNAYGPRFVRAMGYCSDSRGAWHHGEPAQHVAVREGRALQVLVHPFWWQAPATPPLQRLKDFLTERHAVLDRELAHHCTVYR